jgi:3-methyl-2-oxobutanoate hydroxymethyltransferase
MDNVKKVTIEYLMKKMDDEEPITQIAVYDFAAAVLCEKVGIEILCVSDTGASILFGHPSNNAVTMDEVLIMCKAVYRARERAMLMADMPYISYHVNADEAIRNAARLVSEAGMEVMKCEVWPEIAENVGAIVKAGIPVQAHVGITPMRLVALGGAYRTQGRTLQSARQVVEHARMMVDLGCFSILCEGVAEEVSAYLAESLPVPVISLAGGAKAHGVHIIQTDLYGGTVLKGGKRFFPTHGKMYVDLYSEQEKAFRMYADDVINRKYPGPENTFKMKQGELEKFRNAMKWDGPK